MSNWIRPNMALGKFHFGLRVRAIRWDKEKKRREEKGRRKKRREKSRFGTSPLFGN